MIEEKIIQTEEKDYARDISNRALINTNVSALKEYRAKKEQVARLEKVESDVRIIMDTMLEIKRALLELGANK